MTKAFALVYGVVSYFLFLATFLYAIGFVTGVLVPKTIDSGMPTSTTQAVIVDLLLMSLFAIQHSVMARQGFKRWWTQIIPKSVERSTYVLLSSLVLALLCWQWQPLPTVAWQVANPSLATMLLGLSFVGFLIVLISTFLISHFELFGLHQVFSNFNAQAMPGPKFRTPLFYKIVRHPIYLGFTIAFWAAPTMTVGHLLFAVVTTAYMLVAILLEERDLVAVFGEEYARYQKRVPMLLPWRRPM